MKICIYFLLFLLALQFPALSADSSKINIAALDLEPHGGLSAQEFLTISDRLRGELLITAKYVLLNGGKWTRLSRSSDSGKTGVCSEAPCIVEVGLLPSVYMTVGGSIGKEGKAYNINLKIIDVQAGKIEKENL